MQRIIAPHNAERPLSDAQAEDICDVGHLLGNLPAMGDDNEGSREWAIEQLTPGFGCVMDATGGSWYKPSDGVGYRRINLDGGADSYSDDLPVELPYGWSLVT